MNTTANIAVGVTGLIITAGVYSVVLQLATKWQADFTPRFKDAYKACFIVLALIAILSFGLTSMLPSAAPWFIALVIGFLIQVTVYSNILKGPAGEISFMKAIAISFNQLIIIMALIGIVALLKSFF